MTKWTKKEFVDEDFSHQRFPAVSMEECHFLRCRFRQTFLKEISTTRCVFEECHFAHAILNGSTHRGSAFFNCQFEHARLFASVFENCKMTGSSFGEADFTGASIQGGDCLTPCLETSISSDATFPESGSKRPTYTVRSLNNAILKRRIYLMRTSKGLLSKDPI
jgi:hypothetical protein